MIHMERARRGARCKNCGETRNVKEIAVGTVTRYQRELELCYGCRKILKLMLSQEVPPVDYVRRRDTYD